MRPNLLNPLFAAVTTLSGVGPKLDKVFSRLFGRDDGGARLIDLLFHMPTGVVDRRARPKLNAVEAGQIVTVAVDVESHRPPPPNRPRMPYRVETSDDTGTLTLTFFSARKDYLEKILPVGAHRYVSGTAALYDGMLQMVHPDRIVDEAGLANLPLVEPVYPLTEGLFESQLRKAIDGAVDKLPVLPEWQDAAWLAQEKFPPFADALRHLHRPQNPGDVDPETPAWTRLAFDEFLAGQLALALVRAHTRRPSGRRSEGDGRLRKKIIAALPYTLTGSQQKALDDIAADLAKPERMTRLLQGDVGSGKTVVALLACAAVIEAGGQAALMAPTEILARQHHKTIAPMAEAAGIRVALLTGRERSVARAKLLDGLVGGDVDLLIGTHALFQDDVAFKNLALAVVDEQHRFGVHQRLALARKGEAVDMLVMTATPIPRTLVLTYFGDMDFSDLKEKPAGGCRSIRGWCRPTGCRKWSTRSAAPSRKAGASIGSAPLVEGKRDGRSRGGGRTLQGIARALWPGGRPCPRPHERRGERRRDGALRCRRDATSRRHHGHRSRRRCSRSEHHGDRARPNASVWRNCTSCADASAAAARVRPVF